MVYPPLEIFADILERVRECVDQRADESREELRDPVPRWIRQTHRIVEYIGVTVVGLEVERLHDERIGGEHASELRIVDPSVHVDERDALEVLVSCKAPGQLRRLRLLCRILC